MSPSFHQSASTKKKIEKFHKKDGNIYLISPTISYLIIPTNTFILLKTSQCSDQPNEMLLEVFQSSTKATTWHRMVINHHPSPSFQTVAKTCERGAHTFTLFTVTRLQQLCCLLCFGNLGNKSYLILELACTWVN